MKKKKEAPTLLLKAVYEGAELSEQLHQLRTQQKVFDECGLDKEADRLNYHIGKLIKQIDDKVKETQAQRRQLIREMLLAFAAGDIATACADHMEDIFKRLTFGREANGGKSLAKVFKMQADEWNRCVQMVDGMGHNDAVSFLYSDMAEEIVNKVLPVMYEVIDTYMASEKGQKLL